MRGDKMKIGIPKAFLYYRYHQLWETFFKEIDCEVVLSDNTCKNTLKTGIRQTIDENCLPLKIYMGHIENLVPRCDYLFVPHFVNLGSNDQFCIRFLGLYDLVQHTYPNVKLLSYQVNTKKYRTELQGFLKMGKILGKSLRKTYKAYQAGKEAQMLSDFQVYKNQNLEFKKEGPKILIAAQPYISHDPYIGKAIVEMVKEQGGIPVFSDRCNREEARLRSAEISKSLYWLMNKEIIGSIVSCKGRVDGVILLTAFPCGTDSLVNELVMRRIKELPMIQILLDEQQAEAGLQTRIESFMDILWERRKVHA